ncbi:MAG: class III cytochrome C family protein [Rhodoferax sp.]|nr:class III cytochrome C family protein [Rhodoferax sp.]
MTRRWVLVLVSLNLAALLALVFMYPHLMLSPGPVSAGHAAIATDCFACHAPLRGAAASRCMACHALPDIGLRNTQGKPIVRKTLKVSFHQDLLEQDCMACHSDHAGPKLTQTSRKPFSHALLRSTVRTQCQTCHRAPADTLHTKITGNCSQCHAQNAWKPASFDHDQAFALDEDHNVACSTCHVGNDYSRYTCYGCHEHTLQNVLREHRDEGIRDLDNCVRCHRSADGEGGEHGRGDD